MSMPNDAPIACTLAPFDLRRRLDTIRQLTAQELVSHELLDGVLRLTYRARACTAVERIVTAERECCAFLRFDLDCSADGVELVISAPPGLDVEARWLFEQFLPDSEKSTMPGACGCMPGGCG